MTTDRLIVFDVDDTLYLERDYVRSGFAAVDQWARAELGLVGLFDTAWQMFLGGRRGTTLTDACGALGHRLSSAELDAAVGIYRAHAPAIVLCPDARAALEGLDAVAQIAVLTDGPAMSQRLKIAALGLNTLADAVVVTDERPGWGKPAPEGFEFIQRKCGTDPQRCWYVADNPAKDFAAPVGLGWNTLRVNRTGSLHTAVPAPSGLREVADLWGLPEYITAVAIGAV